MTAPLRILAVEDDLLNRVLLRASLAQATDERLSRAQLLEAATLAEAREMLGRGPFDLLLLDRRLPDGDGFTLAAELRAAGQAVPIVALTADAVPATQAAAHAAGCDVVITKPYRPAELVQVLSARLADAAA